MKKFVAALLFVMLIGNAGLSLAEPGGQSDLRLTLGAKLWQNSWSKWMFGGSDLLMSVSDSSEMAFIPSASVKYKNFFISTGYMPETNYTFPDTENYFGFKGSREELDLNAGYYILPSLGLTVGYKDINQHFDYGDYNILGDYVYEDTNTYDFRFSGPTVGLVGGASLGAGFAIYGNAAFGNMTLTRTDNVTDTSTDDDAFYTSSEVGIAFAPSSWLSMTLGYKFQVVETNLHDSLVQAAPDTTKGFILGVNMIF